MTTQTGPEQFRDWIDRRRFTQRDAAKYFGWNEAYISRILSGKHRPGLSLAIQIERATGIPVEAWPDSDLVDSGKAIPEFSRKA